MQAPSPARPARRVHSADVKRPAPVASPGATRRLSAVEVQQRWWQTLHRQAADEVAAASRRMAALAESILGIGVASGNVQEVSRLKRRRLRPLLQEVASDLHRGVVGPHQAAVTWS